MKYGLSIHTIEKIQKVFEANTKLEKAYLFGSRAKHNYKEGSDIDIAVKGKDLSYNDLLDLSGKLDALNLPYKIDLIDNAKITEPTLQEHIERAGKEFWVRKN